MRQDENHVAIARRQLERDLRIIRVAPGEAQQTRRLASRDAPDGGVPSFVFLVAFESRLDPGG